MLKILLRYLSRNRQNPKKIIYRICEFSLILVNRRIFLFWAKSGLFIKQKLKIGNISFIDDKIIVSTKNEIKFIYTPNNEQTLDIEFGRVWEESELNLFKKYLKKGDLFIDIGSHIGWYAINLAFLDQVKVVAFEASSGNYKILVENIRLNNLEKLITAKRIAIGDRQKRIKFTKSDHLGNRIIPIASDSTQEYELVEMTTLDTFVRLNKLDNICGIKCDIEGAELFMLEGAKNTIKKFHPYVLLEIQQEWTQKYGYDANEIFEFMENLGYKYKCVTDDGKVKKLAQRKQELLLAHNFFFYYN